jgi:hypothetical protein
MKRIILSIALIVPFFIALVAFTGEKHKPVPEKEVKKWHNNLHKSPYAVYEKFDGCMFYGDSLLKQDCDTIHLKFLMGCSNPVLVPVTYTLFSLPIYGIEDSAGYTNNYNAIRYFDGKKWIPCDTVMLKSWSANWMTNLNNIGLPNLKAFVVPNDDVQELKENPIYLSFGLKKIQNIDSVKLLLGNTLYIPSNDPSNNNEAGNSQSIYMDACMPCPKVCGINELN